MVSIVKAEEQVLKFWEEDNSFVKSSEKNSSNKFIFFEGPPFATGLPHYGHVLAGLIKDTVCRWACQNGKYVERKATWDSHGLPIEYEIEKAHGIKTKQDILSIGIPAYNSACKSIVLRYSNQWKDIIGRLGRWIDWDSNIKTMDFNYMEKVWSIFASIYSQGLIYEDFKVMPYSNACTTPLSNFEASSNYQTVNDQTVIVKFRSNTSKTSFLVWTTTPWTLPANQALCVNPDLDYLEVCVPAQTNPPSGEVCVPAQTNPLSGEFCVPSGELYFLGEKLADSVLKSQNYTIIRKLKGSELVGLEYMDLFDPTKTHCIYGDSYVNDESGTGIVHLAPGFGEDDYRVCRLNGFVPGDICIPIDDSGIFLSTCNLEEIRGLPINQSIKPICSKLKDLNALFSTFQYTHSYPFCWRSDTPLIYKAVSSWFLKVSDIKDKLIEASEKTNWVPQNIRDNRFHNWLSDARDWCLSRNRFWGTPIPIWKSQCGKVIVVSSANELEKLAGLEPGTITDLHREHIDHIVIIQDGIEYKRIEAVLDCWFESGSIPFVLNPDLPNPCADFIAEGLDQTRGWFYTLLVISTCLTGQAPFKNVIVNGIVNASDGKKMAKRLKNYPDPLEVVNTYGSDALRLYLITSVASKAESIKFKEEEVRGMMQNIILPLTNSFAFYFEYETKFNLNSQSTNLLVESSNPLDHWVLDLANKFVTKLQGFYSSYTLQPIYNLLIEYIDKLNNGYLRLNREHLKSSLPSLSVFRYVLELSILHLAPVLPFLTEYYNLKLGSIQSIHCKEFNSVASQIPWINPTFVTQSAYLLELIDMIRGLRGNLPRKRPIKKAIIKVLPEMFSMVSTQSMQAFIAGETNILDLVITQYIPNEKIYSIKPNYKALGSRSKSVVPILKKLSQTQAAQLVDTGLFQFDDISIALEDVFVDISIPSEPGLVSGTNDELQLAISLDLTQDEQTTQVFMGKCVAREIQQLRKEVGLHPWDPIKLMYSSSQELTQLQLDIIQKSTGHPIEKINSWDLYDQAQRKKINVVDEDIEIGLIKLSV